MRLTNSNIDRINICVRDKLCNSNMLSEKRDTFCLDVKRLAIVSSWSRECLGYAVLLRVLFTAFLVPTGDGRNDDIRVGPRRFYERGRSYTRGTEYAKAQRRRVLGLRVTLCLGSERSLCQHQVGNDYGDQSVSRIMNAP